MPASKYVFSVSFLLLLLSCFATAMPVSKKEAVPQESNTTITKKPNFLQKIILKKIERKINRHTKNNEKVAPLAITAISLVGLGLLLTLITSVTGAASLLLGFLAFLAAAITGAIAKDGSGGKSDKLAKAGMWLGIIFSLLMVLFTVLAVVGLSQWANGWN